MVGLNSVVNEKNNALNASSNDKVTRQIFVTGGVASSLGKGLSASPSVSFFAHVASL